MDHPSKDTNELRPGPLSHFRIHCRTADSLVGCQERTPAWSFSAHLGSTAAQSARLKFLDRP